ncbi:MAG: 16S rRNA (cytosine(1402)-N(4))-methyltransferase RsmH [Ruminococcaceae bacterium]|nr:16S rRNA (cytosine(1402)-N(4))-methyltransferase RsmH [Oscillospiraceae bacterium]
MDDKISSAAEASGSGQYHIPVLLEQTAEAMNIRQGGIYVDGTAGGGGHSAEILRQLGGTGRLIAIDRDPDAIAEVTRRLGHNPNITIVHSEYSRIREVLDELEIAAVDGVLLDIGVSSHQFDCAERGFSYHHDAPLDMRMSSEGTTAADLIAQLDWKQLAEIFSRYGEEKFSAAIAKSICRKRETAPIETTAQLAEIISAAYPAAARRDGHPARKVFQALRIAVNDELGELERGLESAFRCLKTGGRLSVITFHSIEDRITKRAMAEWCKGCTCPPEFPVCVCGKKPRAKLALRHPASATEEELARNPRSRSARLRVCEKLEEN